MFYIFDNIWLDSAVMVVAVMQFIMLIFNFDLFHTDLYKLSLDCYSLQFVQGIHQVVNVQFSKYNFFIL